MVKSTGAERQKGWVKEKSYNSHNAAVAYVIQAFLPPHLNFTSSVCDEGFFLAFKFLTSGRSH